MHIQKRGKGLLRILTPKLTPGSYRQTAYADCHKNQSQYEGKE